MANDAPSLDAAKPMTIGQVADRTGLAVSAIRFYEEKGLITSTRLPNRHRVFDRLVLRRVSFIMITQQLGYTLEEIRDQLDSLDDETPSIDNWERLAANFTSDLNDRIERLELLRDRLSGCIGCGCVSLEGCTVWNEGDRAAAFGPGPRWLLGDR